MTGEAGREVTVTLLLGGGHKSRLRMASDDPLLRSLIASIEDKADGGRRMPRPFHLRIAGGSQSLVFSGSDLVGIIVDPPILPAAAAPRRPAPYVLIESFLDPALHAELLTFVREAEPRFVDATVSTRDADYRRSKVLYEFPRFSTLFRERVAGLAPELMGRFGGTPFPVAEIECQMTAHHDGNYFRLHNDSGSPDTASRVLSYVYYFHNEPKAFTGGEFRLYGSRVENGVSHCGEPAGDIAPRNNSILFFPSHCHHEVLPVRCPSQAFAAGRFTINGWIRRAA